MCRFLTKTWRCKKKRKIKRRVRRVLKKRFKECGRCIRLYLSHLRFEFSPTDLVNYVIFVSFLRTVTNVGKLLGANFLDLFFSSACSDYAPWKIVGTKTFRKLGCRKKRNWERINVFPRRVRTWLSERSLHIIIRKIDDTNKGRERAKKGVLKKSHCKRINCEMT